MQGQNENSGERAIRGRDCKLFQAMIEDMLRIFDKYQI